MEKTVQYPNTLIKKHEAENAWETAQDLRRLKKTTLYFIEQRKGTLEKDSPRGTQR